MNNVLSKNYTIIYFNIYSASLNFKQECMKLNKNGRLTSFIPLQVVISYDCFFTSDINIMVKNIIATFEWH